MRTLLKAAYGRQRLAEVLPRDTATFLPFIVTGSLLAGWHKEGEEWYEFLNRAEAAIEADQG